MALEFLLDFFFPKFCFGCLKIGTYLCPNCKNTIRFTKIPLCPYCEKPSPYGFTHPKCHLPLSLDGLMVIGDYSGVLKKMIHFFKYKNVFSLGKTLIDLTVDNRSFWLPPLDFVTAIPLHKSRLAERGYNQSEIIADLFAKKKNLFYKNHVLIRSRPTKAQMTITDLKLRRQNMKGCFNTVSISEIKNKNIALFDDVATTGATIFEAAKVLKRNGAKMVWGIVLARSL